MKPFSLLFLFLVALLIPAPSASAQVTTKISPAKLQEILLPWKGKIEGSRREVAFITLSKAKDELLTSKVGGKPFLPKGQSLPKNSSGQEMYLLAQINLADVPPLPDFPRSGILQFYISSDDLYGANFEGKLSEEELSVQKDFRVLFHENPGLEAASFPYPPKEKDAPTLPFPPDDSYRMTFSKGTERILERDFEFTQIMGLPYGAFETKLEKSNSLPEDSLEEVLEDYFSEHEFKHQLGGYASFTQEDPRRPGSKKRLLFQMSSETKGDIKIMWGDLGIAGFFIDPADLKKRDFSKVMYNWDCG